MFSFSDFSENWLGEFEIRDCFRRRGAGVKSPLRMQAAAGSVLTRVLTGDFFFFFIYKFRGAVVVVFFFVVFFLFFFFFFSL